MTVERFKGRGRYAGMRRWQAVLHFENLTSMTDVVDLSVVCPHCCNI